MRFSSKHLRAVCFDLYGTIVDISIDTQPIELWELLCEELGSHDLHVDPVELRAEYDRLVDAERREHGQPFVLDNLLFFKLLSHTGRRPHRHTVHNFGRRFRGLTTRSIRVKPYAFELFEFLRSRGCKLAIVSNTEEIVTSHDLDELNLQGQFDAIVLSSAVGVKKPEPRIFHIALHRLGVQPNASLFIGDDYECDYRGSERAGLQALLLSDHVYDSSVHSVRPELEPIIHHIDNVSMSE